MRVTIQYNPRSMVTILAARRRTGSGDSSGRACAAETAVARQRRRAHQGPRQVARGQPRRRLARSRRHVYLPPSYATDKSRRYPVVYLLHGYGGRDDTFNGRLATLPDSADKLAASGAAKEMIVVTPNAYTLHKGSMYSNSVDDRRLGIVRRRRPRRLHGQPLPNDSEPIVARPRRPLDGRLRRGAHRHEAARRVLEPLPHELVLSERAR